MNNQNVLIVEDDPKIRLLLRNVLQDEGFGVFEAVTAAEAFAVINSTPIKLVTLDIHLGADNGIELAREIRRMSHVPIIILTGRADVIDRVVGLEVGADDYITKPFHIREFVARVRSVLRRVATSTEKLVHPVATASDPAEESKHYIFDQMTAFPDRMELLDRNGADCGLTSGDFKLLSVFLTRPKRVLSRDQLMDLTGGLEWSPLDRTIDNQIARLRKKIERDPSDPKLIKTVRGVGYIFACDVQSVIGSGLSENSA